MWRRRVRAAALITALTAAIACSASTPAGPTTRAADISGTWTARIVGVQQRTGLPQADDAVLTLQQSGSSVSGTMQYSGVSSPATLSGTIVNSTIRFTATQELSPACLATVSVDATVSAAGDAIDGSYSASTCEDTVIGTLSARRRG